MIGQAARRALLAAPRQLKAPVRTIYPHMSSNVIAGVPRTHIPFPEKVACGLFIVSCILATPMWVTTHMDDYRGGPVNQA